MVFKILATVPAPPRPPRASVLFPTPRPLRVAQLGHVKGVGRPPGTEASPARPAGARCSPQRPPSVAECQVVLGRHRGLDPRSFLRFRVPFCKTPLERWVITGRSLPPWTASGGSPRRRAEVPTSTHLVLDGLPPHSPQEVPEVSWASRVFLGRLVTEFYSPSGWTCPQET